MTNKVIRSDDPNAVALLKEKLEKLLTLQKEMIAANVYFRKNHSLKGYGNLSEEKAEKLDEQIKNGYSWQRQPYAAYQLQNNNQEINRLKHRIKQIETEQSREAIIYDTEHLGFVVEENQELCRLQISFPGKPDVKIREDLKSRGFHWSPTNDCWQRLLNNSARYDVQSFIRSQEAAHKKEMEAE